MYCAIVDYDTAIVNLPWLVMVTPEAIVSVTPDSIVHVSPGPIVWSVVMVVSLLNVIVAASA